MTTSAPRPIRVGFDDQIFQAQLRGGISKYFVELIRRLPPHGIEPVILSSRTRNMHLAESGLVPRAPRSSRVRERAEWVSWRLLGRPDTAPRRRPALDLLHHTFTHGAYLRRWSGPRVVTIFDMTPELFPEYFRLGNPHFAKRRYSEVSDAVISISHNTATDMVLLYGPGVAERTHVIPFGVGEQFFSGSTPPDRLPPRYLLFVGVRAGYKDFPIALEAFRRLAAEDPALALVVVGGGSYRPDETAAIEATGFADRVVKLAPTDEEMPEVYRRAVAFVFPSRYEGFGLPTLEALAEGTPTILADASCSREVGGAAALYFPPGDVDALVARIREAMSPTAARAAAVAGPAQGLRFGWDQVAAMTADLYHSLVGKE